MAARKRVVFDEDRAKSLCLKGYSAASIAKTLGISHILAWSRLKEMGMANQMLINKAKIIRTTHKNNNHWLGKKHTEKTKTKMSKSAKDYCFLHPEIRKLRRLNSLGENNPMFGSHLSEKQKDNLSIKLKGINIWLKGVRMSKEEKEKRKESAPRGELCHLWKGGPTERTCKECGAVFSFYQSKDQNGEGKYCSRKCYGRHKTRVEIGENNSNWRGGTSFEPYPVQWQRSLKEHIRERDSHICQICKLHESEYGKKLDIHHIDYDKNNLSPANLISLCKSCHSKTSGRRDLWPLFLIQKINEMEAICGG